MLSPHQLLVSVHQSYDVEQAVRVRESLFLFRILGEQEGTQNVTRNLILSINRSRTHTPNLYSSVLLDRNNNEHQR